MKKGMPFIALVSFMIMTSQAFAQAPFHKHYELFKGREDYTVNIVYQDYQGWIWFGTDRGLFRFDGVNNVLFTTADSLADNNITALHLKPDGIMWIGHRNGKITLYDGKKFSPFNPEEGLGEITVSDILSDREGVIWFSTLGEGVFRWEGKYLSNLNLDDGLSDNYIYDIELDKKGTLWFASDNGITEYFDGKTEVLSMKDGLSDNIVRVVKSSPDGRLWIGTDEKGISVFNPETRSFLNISGWRYSAVTGITINREHEVWIGTESDGIIQLQLGEFTFNYRAYMIAPGTESAKINSVIQDFEENIWIGGRKFVTQVLPPIFEFLNDADGTPFEISYDLAVDSDKNLWVCSEKGLYRGLPGFSGSFTWENISEKLNAEKTNFISLFIDNEGQVWAGTYGEGVFRINPGNLKFRLFSDQNGLRDNNVISISGLDSLVWFSTLGGGVTSYNTNSGQLKNYDQPELMDSYIYETATDKSGRTWIAGSTRFPLYLYKDSLYRIRYTGQPIQQFYSVAVDTLGNAWFNAGEKGLLITGGDSAIFFSRNEAISLDRIQAIEFDINNNLIIVSNSGFLFYKPGSGSVLEFGENSWLSYQYPVLNSIYTDKDGKIWIGTETGIIKYNPDYLDFTGRSPRVFLSLKQLFYDPIAQGRNKFRYRENNFTFGYTGIWFSNPEGLKYRYILTGNDPDWTYSDRNKTLTYSNLPPGDYSFIAEVSLDQQNWLRSPDSSFSFTITPPFWRRLWFIAGVTILFFLTVYMYIRLRIKTLKSEKKILEDEVLKRTLEIRNQNKTLEKQKVQIEKQRDLAREQKERIEVQKEEIQSSIYYARRIQSAVLPSKSRMDLLLKDYFILYKPCEIVSGDFYWVAGVNTHILFAAADCTGHGVPGSFMSMLGLGALNDILKSLNQIKASVVLDQLNDRIRDALHQGNDMDTEAREGMDISLCILDTRSNILQFSGANNPVYLIHDNILREYPADRIEIGSYSSEKQIFTNHEIICSEGDVVYLFSDGFTDQVGGKDRKKYKSQRFREFLLTIHEKSSEEQKILLDHEIEAWKGSYEQIDDILVMGIRISGLGEG